MNFNEYQKKARKMAVYPNIGKNYIYPALGLGGENKVPKGIYPAYLYYRNLNQLILAYGVSEEGGALLLSGQI